MVFHGVGAVDEHCNAHARCISHSAACPGVPLWAHACARERSQHAPCGSWDATRGMQHTCSNGPVEAFCAQVVQSRDRTRLWSCCDGRLRRGRGLCRCAARERREDAQCHPGCAQHHASTAPRLLRAPFPCALCRNPEVDTLGTARRASLRICGAEFRLPVQNGPFHNLEICTQCGTLLYTADFRREYFRYKICPASFCILTSLSSLARLGIWGCEKKARIQNYVQPEISFVTPAVAVGPLIRVI